MKPVRIRALERAETFIGVSEQPPGSNRGRLIDRWNARAGVPWGTAWCAAFVCAMYGDVGHPLRFPYRASVGFFEAWARKVGNLVGPRGRPRRGDLVCYRWDRDDWPDHIGFVERVLAVKWRGGRFVGLIRTIEGNTDSRVARKWRWTDGRQRFVRIGK